MNIFGPIEPDSIWMVFRVDLGRNSTKKCVFANLHRVQIVWRSAIRRVVPASVRAGLPPCRCVCAIASHVVTCPAHEDEDSCCCAKARARRRAARSSEEELKINIELLAERKCLDE